MWEISLSVCHVPKWVGLDFIFFPFKIAEVFHSKKQKFYNPPSLSPGGPFRGFRVPISAYVPDYGIWVVSEAGMGILTFGPSPRPLFENKKIKSKRRKKKEETEGEKWKG